MNKWWRDMLAGVFLLAAMGCCASAGAATGAQTSADTAVLPATLVSTLLHEAAQTGQSSQALIVIAAAPSHPHASLLAYSRASGHWQKVMGPMGAVLGERGISLHKREGDMKSPAGIFHIGRSFGSATRPAGIKLPFTRTTPYDYWVDDATSADYNRWETDFGNPDTRWKSYERLRIPAYEYAAVIRYNMDPIRKGQGSAIFLHIWPGPDGHTAGCTAISKGHLLKVLRWLDPAQRPVIIQGTVAQLKVLANQD